MQNKFIAVMDSGIGGIYLLKKLTQTYPHQNFIYFGDNVNAPYGEKSPSKLLSLCAYNKTLFNEYNVKGVVLACNTLSVTLRSQLESLWEVPVIGVFPPIEKLIMKSNLQTVVFATSLTIKNLDSYAKNKVKLFSLPDLAKDLEANAPNFDKVNLLNHLKSNSQCYSFMQNNIKKCNLILGCTHYNFIKKQFFDHFNSNLIYSGENFSLNYIKNLVGQAKSLDNKRENAPLFIGKNSKLNEQIFYKVVF